MSGPTPDRPSATPRSLSCSDAELLFAQAADTSATQVAGQAADNTLDAASQAALDAHLAGCPACTAALADSRRGVAWLALLRDEGSYPEPPAGMVENILALTAGQPLGTVSDAAPATPRKAAPWASVNLAAVRSGMRRTGLWEPRLMLTAAMAFFSISLTLNVMGIHLDDMRPSHLRRTVTRTYYTANAHVVRYYENLRVVYELESRLRELRHAAETTAAPSTNKPAQQNNGAPQSTNPSSGDPSSNGNPGSGNPNSKGNGSGNPSSSTPSRSDDGVAHKDKHSQTRQPTPDQNQPHAAPVDAFSGDVIETAFSTSATESLGKNLSLRSSRRRASVVPQVALNAQRSQA
jgi:hypothetical protein